MTMIPQMRIRIVSLSFQPKSQLIIQKPTHQYRLRCSISALFFSSLQPSEKPIPTAEYLISQHQFSQKTALRASLAIPFLKNSHKSDSVLSYLKESGLSKAHLEKVINKYPEVLSANVETVKPKIKVFQDSGFSPSDVADIVSFTPWLLKQSADNRLGPSVRALRSLLGSDDAVRRVLKRCGWFLEKDLERTMVRNIEFLNKSCGVSLSQITSYVPMFPRFFLLKPESVVEGVRRVDATGFHRSSGLFLQAVRVMCSMTVEHWELKWELFQGLGFSEDEILGMFKREPQVFCVSQEKIKESVEVWLSAGKVDISYVAKYPELLLYSINGRVKPRLEVAEILKRKDLLKKKLELNTIIRLSRIKFLEKYVLPYSDALEGRLCGQLALIGN